MTPIIGNRVEGSELIIMEIHRYSQDLVKEAIKECEGKHIQQVAYSSYHDALTQICFGCDKVRTSLELEYGK